MKTHPTPTSTSTHAQARRVPQPVVLLGALLALLGLAVALVVVSARQPAAPDPAAAPREATVSCQPDEVVEVAWCDEGAAPAVAQATSAVSAPLEPLSDDARLGVWVILARPGGPDEGAGEGRFEAIPPHLRARLAEAFPDRGRFELLDRTTLSVFSGRPERQTLPDAAGSTLAYVYQGRDRATGALRFQLTIQGTLSAQIEAQPGEAFFQAGLPHEEGMLILAFEVASVWL